MADLLMMIEEQRAAIREADRELTDALAQKADLEKRIGYLQWHANHLKRLYALTSSMAQEETSHTRARLSTPQMPLLEKVASTTANGQPKTVKQAIIDAIRENRRPMRGVEVWEVLQKRGVKINSKRPAEVVVSTMRASMLRNQNIFTKDGPAFGLVEWQGARST